MARTAGTTTSRLNPEQIDRTRDGFMSGAWGGSPTPAKGGGGGDAEGAEFKARLMMEKDM